MRAAKTKNQILINVSKKFFAGGGKKKKIDPNLKEFDSIFVGGLHSAITIKYFQVKHFHGTLAGFNHRSKFAFDSLYEQVIAGNLKTFKYSAMPFSSMYDLTSARAFKESITEIRPDKNEVVTSKGDVFKYKSLVLNTGLKQDGSEDPILKDYINDEFGKSRVFVQESGNPFQVNRNTRIFHMHKDGDFLLYLPGGPNKREASDHWYLALDSYLSRGLLTGNRHKGMRIRVITPNDYLFKFPFANEVVLEECASRSMIDVHFGMELTKIDIKQTAAGPERYAHFKDLKTGSEVILPFGTFLTSPANKKRKCFENNDLTDEHGQVLVNPYSLQHVKYPNIFAFGDCTNVPTTKSLYATLNQSVVVRNNLMDYLEGREMKAVYEGYSSFNVYHAVDKLWTFKNYYDYKPTAWNFYIPRFLGWPAFKLKAILEKNYFSRIYSKKANFGYPYVQKDKYFRPLQENKFLPNNGLTAKDVFPHEYVKPVLSYDGHGHEHEHHAESGHAKKDGHVEVAH